MFARRLLTGLATTSVALAGLAFTAGPAMAVITTDPNDVAWVPTTPGGTATNYLIGMGSDTTQGVLHDLAVAYNGKNPANPISTYAATAGKPQSECTTSAPCQVNLPEGDTTRLFGSGAGKRGLYESGTAKDSLKFARASATLTTTEQNAGLQQFPFALDYVVTATASTTNAPATLTPAQILSIYKCDTTTWNQVGGTSSETIAPLLPSASSGTAQTFTAALTRANNGQTVTFGSCVKTGVAENDPSALLTPGSSTSPANTIAPYSEGVATTQIKGGSAIRIVGGGLREKRALYNVVRGTDVSNAGILAMFGSNGYICSPEAKSIIANQGFIQLLPPSKGGVCGQPTNQATSNFTTDTVSTSTGVTVTSASASSARVVARVSASTAPSGTVTFFEGTTAVASNVPLVSGQATATPAAAPGTHTYRAVFTPAANTAFTGSEGTGSGTVAKAASTLKADFAKKIKAGKKGTGTVTITLTGSTAKATGAVTVKEGTKVVGTGTLANGTTKITLKKLKAGKHTLTVSWAGDANANASQATVKVKVAKAKKAKGKSKK